MQDHRENAAHLYQMVKDSRADINRKIRLDDRLVYRVLAATYLIGFGGQYLITVLTPSVAGPAGVFVALAGSVALFVILAHSYTRYNGIRGNASRKPGFFGTAWVIALVLTLTAMILTSTLFPEADILRIAYVTSTVLIGLMYTAAGIVLGGRTELLLGCWLIGTGIIASLLTMPTLLLIIALLTSIGFITASTAHNDREARDRP